MESSVVQEAGRNKGQCAGGRVGRPGAALIARPPLPPLRTRICRLLTHLDNNQIT